jgi:hypothetical protein
LNLDLRLGISGLRIAVSDFGFVVFGIRVQSSAVFAPEAFGLEVCSFKFRFCSVGYQVAGFGFRGSGSEFRVSGFGIPVWGFGEEPEAEVSVLGFRVPSFSGSEGSGVGFRDSGLRVWGSTGG